MHLGEKYRNYNRPVAPISEPWTWLQEPLLKQTNKRLLRDWILQPQVPVNSPVRQNGEDSEIEFGAPCCPPTHTHVFL